MTIWRTPQWPDIGDNLGIALEQVFTGTQTDVRARSTTQTSTRRTRSNMALQMTAPTDARSASVRPLPAFRTVRPARRARRDRTSLPWVFLAPTLALLAVLSLVPTVAAINLARNRVLRYPDSNTSACATSSGSRPTGAS